MPRTFELRKLTATSANPHHDKRHRHGVQAVPAFEAGAVVAYSPPQPWKHGDRELWHSGHMIYKGKTFTLDEATNAAIVATSAPHKAETWQDVALSLDAPGAHWLAAGTLQRLLKSGAVTIEQLQAAALAEASEE